MLLVRTLQEEEAEYLKLCRKTEFTFKIILSANNLPFILE